MAMHHINIGKDEQGAQAYNVCENGEPARVRLHRKGTFEVDHEATILATDRWHHRVVLSARPSAGYACVVLVLILHMPLSEVSFVARLGDDRVAAAGLGAGVPVRDDRKLVVAMPVRN
jgi:hypothetical protein